VAFSVAIFRSLANWVRELLFDLAPSVVRRLVRRSLQIFGELGTELLLRVRGVSPQRDLVCFQLGDPVCLQRFLELGLRELLFDFAPSVVRRLVRRSLEILVELGPELLLRVRGISPERDLVCFQLGDPVRLLPLHELRLCELLLGFLPCFSSGLRRRDLHGRFVLDLEVFGMDRQFRLLLLSNLLLDLRKSGLGNRRAANRALG